MKRLRAIFFQTEAGNEPVRDWLLELSDLDRATLGYAIFRIESEWPSSDYRSVGQQGLYEVRRGIRSGKVEARVMFGIDGSFMVLLHGFDKKPTQQDKEIRIAQDRWRSYQRRLKDV